MASDLVKWFVDMDPDMSVIKQALRDGSWQRLMDASGTTLELKWLPSLADYNALTADDDPAKLVSMGDLARITQSMVQQLVVPLQQRTLALESQLHLAQHRLESLTRFHAAQSTLTCAQTTVAVGQVCRLVVTTRDAQGAFVPFGGLQVSIVASIGTCSAPVDRMDGTYTCDWIGTAIGAGSVTFTATAHGQVLVEHTCTVILTGVRAPQHVGVALVEPVSLAITWTLADPLPFVSTWRVQLDTETEEVVVGPNQTLGRILVPEFATLIEPNEPHTLAIHGLDATGAPSSSTTTLTWQYASAPAHLVVVPATQGQLAISWTDSTPLVISSDPTAPLPPPALFRVMVQAPRMTRIVLAPQTAAAPLLFDPAAHGIGGSNIPLVVSVVRVVPIEQLAQVSEYTWIYTSPNPLTSIVFYREFGRSGNAASTQELADTLDLAYNQTVRLQCRLFSGSAPYFYPGLELHATLAGDAATIVRQPTDTGDGHTFAMRLTSRQAAAAALDDDNAILSTLTVSTHAPTTDALVTSQVGITLSEMRVTGISLTPMLAHVPVGEVVELVCTLEPRTASGIDMVVTVSNFCSGAYNDTPAARFTSSHTRPDGTHGIRILGLVAGASATITTRVGNVYAAALVTVDPPVPPSTTTVE
jgi:hypothetical protein